MIFSKFYKEGKSNGYFRFDNLVNQTITIGFMPYMESSDDKLSLLCRDPYNKTVLHFIDTDYEDDIIRLLYSLKLTPLAYKMMDIARVGDYSIIYLNKEPNSRTSKKICKKLKKALINKFY